MTDNRKVTHVTVLKHYDDGSTEQMAKVQPAVVAAILAAGLTSAQNGPGRAPSQNTYLNADECPVHGPWRAVPAGTSKAGRAYAAFWACDQDKGEPRCTNKPSREWIETHPPERAGQAPSSPASPASDFDSLPF